MIGTLRKVTRRALLKAMKFDFSGYALELLLVDSKPIRDVVVRDQSMQFSIGSTIVQVQLSKRYEGAGHIASSESETLDFLQAQIRDGDVFCDVGANFGFYVIWVAHLAKLR